jgi:hypothetical protein
MHSAAARGLSFLSSCGVALFLLLPRWRGRIQEGASRRPGVGQVQIGMISSSARWILGLSPSFILPRMTGEEP